MNELKQRLADLAETPGPDAAVDAPAAIARGRRVRRRRRWTAVLAAAAITAAVTVPAMDAVRPDGPEPARIVEPVKSRPSLVERAAFGWLPEGYVRTSMNVGKGADDQEVFTTMAERGSLGKGVTLTVYPPGREPDVQDPRAKLTKAKPLRGRPADWIAEPGGALPPKIRFQYRADAWATLQVNDTALMNVQAIRRIAESIRFEDGRPAKFPVRIAGIPEGLQLAGTGVGRRSGAGFTLRDEHGGMLQISVDPTDPRARDGENTTIDGHTAYDSRLPDDEPQPIIANPDGKKSYYIVVYEVEGFDIRLSAGGDQLVNLLDESGGLTALFQRITVLGPDESKWTTTPLG
ncbi:hypothetical protein [Actinomadura algeriensis]|uniref:DUF4367 domain-containing protein n=1 Tax=Actinomadura algeriensis TaxID=1679523 RepID=A0ABR9JMT3_9ACTN|nr:hypothetical protein [Actinomadura algeriensis]MBE1531450.1 hypothetical protein [Actinomadura algeriensis]